MTKKRPLWQDVSAKILPFTLVLFVIVSAVQFIVAARFDQRESAAQLNTAGEQFAQRVDEFVTALLDQIESIAENSIVINALIDLSGRKDYLPLYLETIGVFGNTDIAVRLVDFENKMVDANFLGESFLFPAEGQWFNQVLNEGKRWVYFDNRGLFVAEPVFNHGFAEGAILILVPSALFVENFSNIGTGYRGEIADSTGIVLMSLPKPKAMPEGAAKPDDKVDVSPFIKSTTANIETRIIRPTHHYFSTDNIFLSIVLQSLALIAFSVLLILLFSIKSIKELVAGMANAFGKTIQSGDLNARIDHEKWAHELAEVGEQFNVMMSQLQSTTASRNDINTIFDSMNEYVVVVDRNNNITFSNRHGSDSESTPANLFESLNLTKENILFNDALHQAEVEHHENGTTTLWRKSPLVAGEQTKGWVFVGSDITEIRNAQQQMHLLELAIDSSSNGMIVVDATSHLQPIVFANKSFTDITGYQLDEVLGRKCNFLQGPESADETKLTINDGIKNNQPVSVEILNYRKNGDKFWNQLSIDPVFNDQGNVTHFLGIIRDISGLVAQREELRLAKEAAELAAVVKSEFLATMSHEIRTPMNGVLGMLSLLMKTDLNSEQIHRAKLAHNSARSLLSLINDILDFSKIEAGKLELESISFNLNEMLGELCETLAFPAEAKNLEVILDLNGVAVSHIQADIGRIRQIITNLISNSIKFTESGEILVQVGLGEEGEGWRLFGRVVDSGIGIPQEKQSQLFEAFSQVDASTTREYGGTGLGLAIVRSLCELMGGHIRVMSEVGRGSIFEFEILVERSPEAKIIQPPVDIAGQTILVADSNQTVLDVLRGQLKQWGANVLEAKSMAEVQSAVSSTPEPIALAFIASNRHSLPAIDIALFLREQQASGSLRLVNMTAMNRLESDSADASTLFDAHFPKPVTCADIQLALSTLAPGYVSSSYQPLEQSADQLNDPLVVPSNARLLIVDDNQINQTVALGMLDEYGIAADCATNGRETIEMLQTSLHDAPYTLILMDCQMPEMDGFEATRRIREGEAGERYRQVAIIAMTANAMQGDRERCIASGMDDYLAKPIEFLPLKTKLNEWLNKVATLPAVADASGPVAAEPIDLPTDSKPKTETNVIATNEEEHTMTDSSYDIAIWDKADVLKRVANNEKLLTKLVALYLNDNNARLLELRAAFEKTDHALLANLTHTLKGVSANLSATELNECCNRLEAAIKNAETGHLDLLVNKVEQAHSRLVLHFEAYLKNSA